MTETKMILLLLLGTSLAHGQLTVTVSPVKVTGQKAIVSLAMKNNLAEKIESARAAVFLLDEQGKMIGQATKWVIGGSHTNGLAAGATNGFHFVITSAKTITTTNLTATLSFSRVVLEGGKLIDVSKAVTVTAAAK